MLHGMTTLPLARACRSMLLAVLLVSASGCCHHPPQLVGPDVVAVREAQLRSDDVPLPLTPDGRTRLLAFLRTGGDRDFLEDPPQVPDADARYGPLLDLLSSPEHLQPQALTDGTYRRWFASPPLRQVIDARKDRPTPLDAPYALNDGRYWWVFSRGDEGTLAKLVVFKALEKREEPTGAHP